MQTRKTTPDMDHIEERLGVLEEEKTMKRKREEEERKKIQPEERKKMENQMPATWAAGGRKRKGSGRKWDQSKPREGKVREKMEKQERKLKTEIPEGWKRKKKKTEVRGLR